jgi:hypothetical protein
MVVGDARLGATWHGCVATRSRHGDGRFNDYGGRRRLGRLLGETRRRNHAQQYCRRNNSIQPHRQLLK